VIDEITGAFGSIHEPQHTRLWLRRPEPLNRLSRARWRGSRCVACVMLAKCSLRSRKR